MAALVGMAADQILELNVVLPNGRFVKANEDENPDLYWALRGGGGSKFALSLLVRNVVRRFPLLTRVQAHTVW